MLGIVASFYVFANKSARFPRVSLIFSSFGLAFDAYFAYLCSVNADSWRFFLCCVKIFQEQHNKK